MSWMNTFDELNHDLARLRNDIHERLEHFYHRHGVCPKIEVILEPVHRTPGSLIPTRLPGPMEVQASVTIEAVKGIDDAT